MYVKVPDPTPNYDQGLPSLDEATLSVDALVADSTIDDFGPRLPDQYETAVSRSSTPTVPPGFELPHAHPLPPAVQEAPIKPPSRIVPTSAPFTPSRSASFIPRTATPLSNVSLPDVTPKIVPQTPTSLAKQDVKALATTTGLSKTIVSQSSKTLQSEDFPALDSVKSKAPPVTPSKAPRTPAAGSKKNVPVTPTPTMAVPVTPTPAKSEKRPPPGILNISVPPKPALKTTTPSEPPSKPSVASSAFPPLPPSTPSASSTQSPLVRGTPKTLRLVPSKADAPTVGSATPSSVTSAFQPIFPSRQPSLASISRHERPGTPTSEAISDNASITSASLSRASSPPPSKVGSAPVRITTKSKQKKQRQKEKERSEMEAAAAAAAAKVEPEEIAPIMGRKRKQQKEKHIHSAAGGSTPAVSRPPSPGPSESASKPEELSSKDGRAQPNQKNTTVEPEPEASRPTPKSKGKGKHRNQAAPPPPPTPSVEAVKEIDEETKQEPVPKKAQTSLTPQVVFEQLVEAGLVPAAQDLALLKNPAAYAKASFNDDLDNHPGAAVLQKLTITPEDRASLQAGIPVRKNQGTPHSCMLTPNGDYVKHLAPHEENRYLELQEVLAEEAGPAAFVSTKHHATNGFTLIGGRAVPNGPPSFFPPPKGTPATLDPVSKIQRDEALSYINQYVLPSLSTNSQLEKALNANALDAEMLRSSDPLSFPSWGNDPAGPRASSSHGDISQEGILATGLEGMTARFREGDGGRPLGNVSLLSFSEAEVALQSARKDAEVLDKKLQALIKKNRRLLLGTGH
ncbi:hypothetical protein HYFRA_00008370 [Hymenoscyphus fraxineus]|uniref:General negative regulator of transcription subunit 4 n=1 Tax=Hymenoscyphus fraxineus TaxID=746836 RepID=A0A9N9PNM6_9HELO|nr:hypothetical protein HYFRA_00008370 [Hymenoscyphus fraxineus]